MSNKGEEGSALGTAAAAAAKPVLVPVTETPEYTRFIRSLHVYLDNLTKIGVNNKEMAIRVDDIDKTIYHHGSSDTKILHELTKTLMHNVSSLADSERRFLANNYLKFNCLTFLQVNSHILDIVDKEWLEHMRLRERQDSLSQKIVTNPQVGRQPVDADCQDLSGPSPRSSPGLNLITDSFPDPTWQLDPNPDAQDQTLNPNPNHNKES